MGEGLRDYGSSISGQGALGISEIKGTSSTSIAVGSCHLGGELDFSRCQEFRGFQAAWCDPLRAQWCFHSDSGTAPMVVLYIWIRSEESTAVRSSSPSISRRIIASLARTREGSGSPILFHDDIGVMARLTPSLSRWGTPWTTGRTRLT